LPASSNHRIDIGDSQAVTDSTDLSLAKPVYGFLGCGLVVRGASSGADFVAAYVSAVRFAGDSFPGGVRSSGVRKIECGGLFVGGCVAVSFYLGKHTSLRRRSTNVHGIHGI
jgi:hypothetical protein